MSGLGTPADRWAVAREQDGQAAAKVAPPVPMPDLPRNATIEDVHAAMSPGLPDHHAAMTGPA